jgi:hypothetical protein
MNNDSLITCNACLIKRKESYTSREIKVRVKEDDYVFEKKEVE